MPQHTLVLDRANFEVFNISCYQITFIYISILYCYQPFLPVCVICVLLTLSRKSPVFRPSIVQSADGLFRVKVRAYGLPTSAPPPLLGGFAIPLAHCDVGSKKQQVPDIREFSKHYRRTRKNIFSGQTVT